MVRILLLRKKSRRLTLCTETFIATIIKELNKNRLENTFQKSIRYVSFIDGFLHGCDVSTCKFPTFVQFQSCFKCEQLRIFLRSSCSTPLRPPANQKKVFGINGRVTGNWREAALFSITVAVGLVPEMLRTIVNANLCRGAVAYPRTRPLSSSKSRCDNRPTQRRGYFILCTVLTSHLRLIVPLCWHCCR